MQIRPAAAMVRYPDGLGSAGIMQKNMPRYFPDWVRTADVPKQGGHGAPARARPSWMAA